MLKRSSRFAVTSTLLPLLAVTAGCQFLPKQAAAPTVAPAPTPKPGPQPPKIDYARIRPNELGQIPVIMYHEIKGTQNKSLTRSIADFRKDLELMYEAGFRPVNLSDVVNDRIDVPPGKSPIVLTFDDARASQFRLIETASSLKVDEDCAVGIMEAFNKKHPDWALRGTFFVLPKSKSTLETFGQPGMGAQKMAYLIEKGFEIGNHSTSHKSMRKMTPAQIQQELGYANNMILSEVPDARIDVFAVPMGVFPKDKTSWQYLLKGTYEGKEYRHKAAFAAAWRPIPSPASKKYSPYQLERIDSINGTNGVRDWIKKLTTTGSGYTRYVSDGDPNVISFPKGEGSLADTGKIKAGGKLAYAYEPFGGTGGSKPIISVGGSDPNVQDRPIDTTPPGAKRTTEGTVILQTPISSGG
ncbi:MAG: polysaccharide deacetylase family protein [Capsulimonadales bacterium]|nr:polysaccharide deacetylase family protein [Capsulimonadales bacterium]